MAESGETTDDTARSLADVADFFKAFEIESMITHKSIAARCFKLRNQRFFLKQITEAIPNEPFQGEAFREEDEGRPHHLQLLKPWTDMIPQLPHQHWLQCYGVIRINNRYYYICDLVEDNKLIPF